MLDCSEPSSCAASAGLDAADAAAISAVLVGGRQGNQWKETNQARNRYIAYIYLSDIVRDFLEQF